MKKPRVTRPHKTFIETVVLEDLREEEVSRHDVARQIILSDPMRCQAEFIDELGKDGWNGPY